MLKTIFWELELVSKFTLKNPEMALENPENPENLEKPLNNKRPPRKLLKERTLVELEKSLVKTKRKDSRKKVANITRNPMSNLMKENLVSNPNLLRDLEPLETKKPLAPNLTWMTTNPSLVSDENP